MNEERKIKVLCVEDEHEILDTMAEILRDEGFEVFEANNGKKGFESFLHNKPDIIISDIMMPELDGYGFLKMVRESKDKNHTVPFIFLSALGQKENVLKGVDLMANDYLVKPIDFEILIAKIKEKTANAMRVQKLHNVGIKNIKSQISAVLPAEVFSYLDTITQMLKMLKEEPYGPFPHRRYAEDIGKIYFDAIKLKAAVTNALDHNVIDSKLSADEEIFSLVEFMDHAVTSLPEKLRSRVVFEMPYEGEFLPKVKMDKSVLVDIIKKIIAGAIKAQQDSTIRIAVMTDTLNQMVVIFYLKSKLDFTTMQMNIDPEKVAQIADAQGCYFKLTQGMGGEINAILSVPSYRLVANV